MKKVLILVLSCKKLQDRKEGILNSYASLLGRYENVEICFYSDHEEKETNTYLLPCKFSYSHRDNEIKVITAFNYLIQEVFKDEYDWYFFVDDDTFVNIPSLVEKIDEFDENFPVGMDIRGQWEALKYLSGGAGFLIPSKIREKFSNLENFDTGFSDVSLGMNMQKRRIEFKHSDYFDWDSPFKEKVLKISEEEIKRKITYHRISPEQMIILNEYVKKVYL